MLAVLFQKIDENYALKICPIKAYPLHSKLRLVERNRTYLYSRSTMFKMLRYTVQRLLINKCETDCATGAIDLFTDTAAILNLLDLRSIMGCPGGTRLVFTRACRAKRELHCIFLGKEAIIITFKHGTTIIFLITIFLKENLKKNLPEKHA